MSGRAGSGKVDKAGAASKAAKAGGASKAAKAADTGAKAQAAKRAAQCWPEATLSEFEGVRYLHLDSPWVQGAMRLRKPLALELEYVQRMMAGLLFLPLPGEASIAAEPAHGEASKGQGGAILPLHSVEPWAERRALQLGLGAASLTRFCHGVLGLHTTAVEINPQVIQACRLWFRLPQDDERCEVRCADAADFVEDPGQAGLFSLLQVDLYDHEAAGPVLDSPAFYAACRRLLSPGGVMTVNLFGRHASFWASAEAIQQAFEGGVVCSLRPTREGNTVVVASSLAQMPSRECLAARAQIIEDNWKLPARKWLRMVRGLGA
jgi:spermidine synthase